MRLYQNLISPVANMEEVFNAAEAEPTATDGLGEEVLQLDRRFGLELGERARLRILVGPPAHEADAVPESPVFESIEGHLADELGAQRLPGQIAVLRPAARPTRCAATLKTGAPAQRLQPRHQLAPLGVIEARGMADVLQRFPVVDPEQ